MSDITPAIQERIEDHDHESMEHLARTARHFTTAPDAIIPGAFVVRNPKIPGTIEIVMASGTCSCRRFRVWGRCKHAALVAIRHGRREVIAA